MELKKILPIILLIGLYSCKKPFERSCFKGKGKPTTVSLNFDKETDSLYLFDDLYYTLVPSNKKAGTIQIQGGKNLVPFVEVEKGNHKLTIHNKNKCKFLRSYQNKIKVKIYVDTITYIDYRGSRSLKNTDTLRSGELRLLMEVGNGTAELTVANNYMSASCVNGFGNFILKGQSKVAYIYCRSNSYCDTRLFQSTKRLKVNSMTAATMKVNAMSLHFDVSINRNGDVEYIGSPGEINLDKKGSGNLLKYP